MHPLVSFEARGCNNGTKFLETCFEILEASFQARICTNFHKIFTNIPKLCTNFPKMLTDFPKLVTNFPKGFKKNIATRFLNNFQIYGTPRGFTMILMHHAQKIPGKLQNVGAICTKNSLQLYPVLPFLVLFGKRQGKPHKNKDFSSRPTPQIPEKEGKMLGKTGNSSQGEKTMNSKKQGKEGQGK